MVELKNFVVDDHKEETEEFKPLPAGTYRVVIADSDAKMNSKGTGRLATFRLQVSDGKHQNRLLWWRCNIEHSNATAQRIGLSELAKLCEAAGLKKIDHTEELHNKIVGAVVAVKPHWQDPERSDNEVKRFIPLDEMEQEVPSVTTETETPW